MRVVVNPDGTNAQFVNGNVHRATVVHYPDNNTIFGELTNGHADVMITDTSEIRWEAKQNPQLCGVSIGHPFTFEQKAYLIPAGRNALQQWVDQWLNIAQNDGTFASISQRWIGIVGSTGPQPDPPARATADRRVRPGGPADRTALLHAPAAGRRLRSATT